MSFLYYLFALFKAEIKIRVDCVALTDERRPVHSANGFIHLHLTFCSITSLQLIPHTVQHTIFTQTLHGNKYETLY